MDIKKIRERTYLKRFITFAAGCLVGYIFYICIFCIVTPEEVELSQKYDNLSMIFSLVTMIFYMIISEFNYIKKLEITVKALYSNISIYKKHENELISKAEKIVSKFLYHESDIQKSIASSRSESIEATNHQENLSTLTGLKITLENYPELKGDKHISSLLSQLEEAQNKISYSKLTYNTYVSYHNTAIINFPAVIFSGLWKLSPLDFYIDKDFDK